MCLDFWLRSRALAAVGFCLGALSISCPAQTIIAGNSADEYYRFASLGIESAGTVFILGRDEFGSATVFRLRGTTLELIHLSTPPSGKDTEVTKISTAARYAIGTFGPADGGDRGVLWERNYARAVSSRSAEDDSHFAQREVPGGLLVLRRQSQILVGPISLTCVPSRLRP